MAKVVIEDDTIIVKAVVKVVAMEDGTIIVKSVMEVVVMEDGTIIVKAVVEVVIVSAKGSWAPSFIVHKINVSVLGEW